MTDPDAPRRPRLPDVALAPRGGGDVVPLRARRQGTVLVLLGPAPSPEDAAALGALADAGEALRGWDGRVLVLLPDADAAPPDTPFPVLVDPEGRVAAAAGVAPPALVVADQWGEVHDARAVGEGRPWPSPADVEEWLRFLAIRCAG